MPALQCVLETLNDPALNSVLPFTVANVEYNGHRFAEVRRLVEGLPPVVYVSGSDNTGGAAVYNSLRATPSLVLPFRSFPTETVERILCKSLIVHECIHVIQDRANAVWMRVETAEAAAYIGQFLFRYNRVSPPSPTEYSGIFYQAHRAAARMVQSGTRNLRYDQLTPLLEAIRSRYLDAATTGRYNGIPIPETAAAN